MAVTPKAANAPPNMEAHSTAETELSMDFSAMGAAEDLSPRYCHAHLMLPLVRLQDGWLNVLKEWEFLRRGKFHSPI